MLQITKCIHFSKPHMNTKTVAMFCHATLEITMHVDNIVYTNGDVIHFYLQIKFIGVIIYLHLT